MVLQRSLREGFGLGASEALWKGTPVVGGREGGIPLQVRDGVDGYLADDEQDTAERVVELVRDPGLAVEMGRAGRERVRERFLVTRALEDELRAARRYLGARVNVTLPDGTPLELPDGATGADAAARDRRGPGAGRAGIRRTASCST